MKAKVLKVVLDSYGSFLGMEKGCFIVRDKDKKEKRYPLFESEIGEFRLHSGNSVSVGALNAISFWQIDTTLFTGRGRPLATVRSLEDNSHVETRVAQYKSLENGKLPEIAKEFVLAKLEGQNKVLSKYALKCLDYSHFERVRKLEEGDIRTLRIKLTNIESVCSRNYFSQIFQMFYEFLRPKGRKGFKAFDKLNNLLNLSYEVLAWRVHVALLRARLEPFLGYLHSPAWGKPSLVYDFVELYRYLIDDFVIEYSRSLKPKDFILKAEDFSSNRKGKREYLDDFKTRDFMKRLDGYFLSEVQLPRYRMGKKQELETLISEEAMLFAKYLRDEKPSWSPRIAELC
jgi:CRISPR-associated protein Cas1